MGREEFANAPEGRDIRVDLIPPGSMEGAHATLDGDKRINVWSPAIVALQGRFVQDWSRSSAPTRSSKEESLALTPMVFVMWDERYEAFAQKVRHAVSFTTSPKRSRKRAAGTPSPPSRNGESSSSATRIRTVELRSGHAGARWRTTHQKTKGLR